MTACLPLTARIKDRTLISHLIFNSLGIIFTKGKNIILIIIILIIIIIQSIIAVTQYIIN